MKKVYFYNPKTFEFVGTGLAQIDPQATKITGKTIYTKPANSTYVELPKLKDFQIAVFDKEAGEWNVKTSYKGNYKWNINTGNISEITNNEPLKSYEILVDKNMLNDVLANPIKYDVINGKIVDISKMQVYQSKYNIRKYKKLIQEAKEAYIKFQETPVEYDGMTYLPRYIDDYAKLANRTFPLEVWDSTGTKSKVMSANDFNKLRAFLEALDNKAYSIKKNAIKKYKIEIAKLEKNNG